MNSNFEGGVDYTNLLKYFKSLFTLQCSILKVRFQYVRCTKRYVRPKGSYNESSTRTNCDTTKVNFDQTEEKVKEVSVADGGKIKVIKTKGEV